MSHELYFVNGRLVLDNNLIDNSYRLLTEEQVDAEFNEDWREHVINKDDRNYTKEEAEAIIAEREREMNR